MIPRPAVVALLMLAVLTFHFYPAYAALAVVAAGAWAALTETMVWRAARRAEPQAQGLEIL